MQLLKFIYFALVPMILGEMTTWPGVVNDQPVLLDVDLDFPIAQQYEGQSRVTELAAMTIETLYDVSKKCLKMVPKNRRFAFPGWIHGQFNPERPTTSTALTWVPKKINESTSQICLRLQQTQTKPQTANDCFREIGDKLVRTFQWLNDVPSCETGTMPIRSFKFDIGGVKVIDIYVGDNIQIVVTRYCNKWRLKFKDCAQIRKHVVAELSSPSPSTPQRPPPSEMSEKILERKEMFIIPREINVSEPQEAVYQWQEPTLNVKVERSVPTNSKGHTLYPQPFPQSKGVKATYRQIISMVQNAEEYFYRGTLVFFLLATIALKWNIDKIIQRRKCIQYQQALEATCLLQRVYRGILGRKRARIRKMEKERDQLYNISSTKIQVCWKKHVRALRRLKRGSLFYPLRRKVQVARRCIDLVCQMTKDSTADPGRTFCRGILKMSVCVARGALFSDSRGL